MEACSDNAVKSTISYPFEGQDIRFTGVDDRKSAYRKRFSTGSPERRAGTFKGVNEQVLVCGNFCFDFFCAITRKYDHPGSAVIDAFFSAVRA